eukprot:CAMPEP_0116017850 /NCGR_PEP_ID=MMETSP0321-20121206/8300_1 /TAXON_ID=163516 /ORGANISM="Leptocylindrus danicus var. danicus, Strain B650" /LENGTH=216 /DNA_ID=CAMNT_0003488135 /DNA_START=125 /DNA_END=775 /DNA_ORIENTATION=-
MDNWTPEQLQIMKAGGNQQCMDYLKSKGVAFNVSSNSSSREDVRARYDNEAAADYKVQLKAKANGQPNDIDVHTTSSTGRQQQRQRRGRYSSSNKRKQKQDLFQGASANEKLSLTPAQEAHQITTSLLRTKHLMEQNLDRTQETSSALESDAQALKQAREGQSDIVHSTKGAKGALRALKRQDVQERVVLICAVGFYCIVALYVLWTRIRIPFILW